MTLLFTGVVERQPSIVFIDQVETLIKRRDSSDTLEVQNIKDT